MLCEPGDYFWKPEVVIDVVEVSVKFVFVLRVYLRGMECEYHLQRADRAYLSFRLSRRGI